MKVGVEMGNDDVEDIINMMDSELGEASNRQDASARAKFDAFLAKHVKSNTTLSTLKSKAVTKDMFEKNLSFLLKDQHIQWQTSTNYVSSVKRQLEESTGTRLFKEEGEWFCIINTHR